MNIHPFLLYFATWSLVALTPGPAVVCAMTHATRYGFRHALVGILGIQLGHFVFFGCVATGLVTLLAATSTAFTVIRMLGAIYLFYLGIRTLTSTFHKSSAEVKEAGLPARRSLFLQGFAIQVTNPKALIFMSSLLPQSIQPEQPLSFQLSVLLATTITVDVLVLSTYAYFAVRGVQSLRNHIITVWLERAFGAALILFGIKLLSAARK